MAPLCYDYSMQVTKDAAGSQGADRQPFAYPQQHVVRLKPSEHVVYCCPSKDVTEHNCALEMYWQLGENNIEDRLLADALDQLMAEPIYDQLRTKEQLGYSVGCCVKVTAGVLGFCVTVQSSAFGPAHLYKRVRAFLSSFMETLAAMELETFSMHMSSLAANKLQKDNALIEEAERHWSEINSRRCCFHVNIIEARALTGVTHSSVLKAYQEWFFLSASQPTWKPCFTVMVAGMASYNAEEEWKALETFLETEACTMTLTSTPTVKGDGLCALSTYPRAVRIETPQDLHALDCGRDLFTNLGGET
ncbi:unnamed protein product [Choristocarpus tenellus]